MVNGKRIKSIFRLMIHELFIISCIILACTFVLQLFGIKTYILKSGSMEPQYKEGSLVLLNTRTDISDIRTGDVIVYRASSGDLVMHRLIAYGSLKGDANITSEHVHLTEANYVGRAFNRSFRIPCFKLKCF